MENTDLLPYELPLKIHGNIIDWVFDYKDDFIFQFHYKNHEMNQKIIDSINSEEHKPLFKNKDDVDKFLFVRTYGVLVGRYKSSSIEAQKKGIEIYSWIVKKLTHEQS